MDKNLKETLRHLAKDFHETMTGQTWPAGFLFPEEGCGDQLIDKCWGMARISFEHLDLDGNEPPTKA